MSEEQIKTATREELDDRVHQICYGMSLATAEFFVEEKKAIRAELNARKLQDRKQAECS